MPRRGRGRPRRGSAGRAAPPRRASTPPGGPGHLEQRRLLDPAPVERERAARVEPAARGMWTASGVSPTRIVRCARSPARADPATGRPRRAPACTGCAAPDDLLGRADLHDPAEVHHGDPVGDHPRQRQVVGDEQVGQAALAAQVEHQAQELGADRDVEHRDRLVGDHELRVHHQRAGDHDALPLAARQLVRVAAGEVRRRAQPADSSAATTRRVALRARRADVVDDRAAPRRTRRSCASGSASRTGPGRSAAPAGGTRAAPWSPHSVDTSSPSNTIRPPVWRVSFTTTRPVVVLPDPDSPTSARISPLRIVRSMPSTARTTARASRSESNSPPRIGKWTSRSSRRSSSSPTPVSAHGSGRPAAVGPGRWHRATARAAA